MREPGKLARFELIVLPHLDAAHNLARWLIRNAADAEDMVQEACLRAFAFFDGFHGEDARAWLLAIVRNTCYTWLRKNRAHELMTPFDEQIHGTGSAARPETLEWERIGAESLRRALDRLPAEFREILVLREVEGMSYKQIAGIAEIPLGTVMSRLARARKKLSETLGVTA